MVIFNLDDSITLSSAVSTSSPLMVPQSSVVSLPLFSQLTHPYITLGARGVVIQPYLLSGCSLLWPRRLLGPAVASCSLEASTVSPSAAIALPSSSESLGALLFIVLPVIRTGRGNKGRAARYLMPLRYIQRRGQVHNLTTGIPVAILNHGSELMPCLGA